MALATEALYQPPLISILETLTASNCGGFVFLASVLFSSILCKP